MRFLDDAEGPPKYRSQNAAMNENVPSSDSFEAGERTTLAQRLAFLQMTDDDRQRLRALAPRLNASSDAFVEQFYRHLFSFQETARFLEDPALVARLKKYAASPPSVDARGRRRRGLRRAAAARRRRPRPCRHQSPDVSGGVQSVSAVRPERTGDRSRICPSASSSSRSSRC